jgi:hypothetical protein
VAERPEINKIMMLIFASSGLFLQIIFVKVFSLKNSLKSHESVKNDNAKENLIDKEP